MSSDNRDSSLENPHQDNPTSYPTMQFYPMDYSSQQENYAEEQNRLQSSYPTISNVDEYSSDNIHQQQHQQVQYQYPQGPQPISAGSTESRPSSSHPPEPFIAYPAPPPTHPQSLDSTSAVNKGDPGRPFPYGPQQGEAYGGGKGAHPYPQVSNSYPAQQVHYVSSSRTSNGNNDIAFSILVLVLGLLLFFPLLLINAIFLNSPKATARAVSKISLSLFIIITYLLCCGIALGIIIPIGAMFGTRRRW